MNSPVLFALGQRIMRLRSARFSREEFAHLIPIHPKCLYNIEMGISEPGCIILRRIADLLGTTTDALMDGIGDIRKACDARHEELQAKMSRHAHAK